MGSSIPYRYSQGGSICYIYVFNLYSIIIILIYIYTAYVCTVCVYACCICKIYYLVDVYISLKIKGPDNPTSQLLPIISMKGCSRDGERRLGERRR